MKNRMLALALAVLTLAVLIAGCGTKIVHCDHCGAEIELPQNDKIEEDWIVFCKTCEEELFGDNPVIDPGDGGSEETAGPSEEASHRAPMELDLADRVKMEGIEAPADAKVSLDGVDTILTEPVRGSNAGPLDTTRPYYGTGTCTTLTNRPHVLYLMVSDNESRWSEEEALYCINNYLSPGVWWIEDEAARWGVELCFGGSYYLGTGDGYCHYDGILNDCDAGGNGDILEKVTVSMGFANKEEFYRMTQNWTGSEDVVIVVVPNKPGRSYAFMDGVNDEYDYMEHCVVFGQSKYVAGGVYPACPATTAHEILHCFGAEDYYYQDSTRRGIAEAYYPSDIMLVVYMDDIRYNNIGQYTAYTLGWTDYAPNVCYDDRWWN